MKKIICLLLVTTMIFAIGFSAIAEENITIDDIAENVIVISISEDENKNLIYTYDNIDTFINTIRQELPELTDKEIADFIMEYTGQQHKRIAQEDNLFVLDFKSIISTKIRIGDNAVTDDSINAIMPLASWQSNDGKMWITTNCGLKKTVGTKKYYTVYASAYWEDGEFPLMRLEDTFAVAHNAVYDDSVSEGGSFEQIFYCDKCGEYTARAYSVDGDDKNDGTLKLMYASFAPYIAFNSFMSKCDYCTLGSPDDVYFGVFLHYGIIVNSGNANVQAGYAHKTVGPEDSVSVSVDIEGLLSFSGSFGTLIKEYTAEPVTI